MGNQTVDPSFHFLAHLMHCIVQAVTNTRSSILGSYIQPRFRHGAYETNGAVVVEYV